MRREGVDDLAQSFVAEARDWLEEANASLLALEERPGDAGLLNGLFRAVHSLKGAAGLFDLPPLIQVAHAAEDLLGRLRDGALTLDGALTDDLLAALDAMARWVVRFEAEGGLDAEAARLARGIAGRLRARLGSGPDVLAAPVAPGGAEVPAWLDADLRARAMQALAGAARKPEDLVALCYEPSPNCFFSGDDPLFLARQVPGALVVDVVAREDWPAPDLFDPYACNLRIRVVADAPVEEIEHLFRYVAAEVDIRVLPAGTLGGNRPAGAPDAAPGARGAMALTPLGREVLASQRRLLAGPGATAARRVVGHVLTTHGRAPPAADLGDDGIAAMIDALLADGARVSTGDASAVLAGTRTAPPETVPDALPGEGSPKPDRDAPERVLRVDQSRVDALMALVGEMVVAKNALPFLARRAEGVFGARDLAREIKDQHAAIDRIIKEMQGTVMDIRMLPVSEMFRRFPRLVRDLARKLGKTVRLDIEGEATRADKTVIEALAEPLTHILRNSLDHGIESPEERRAHGKPETAVVTIRASQEGDRVVIEVIDDGRGIDPARIRAKAVERGLLDEERARAMPDAEAVQLVFHPGLSTAQTVSDVSGRGVGMDAVRSTVERHGGEARLRSTLGRGTTMRLSLPLGMAVTRVMAVESEGQIYGIPMDLVVETVRLPRTAFRRVKSAEVVTLREEVLPVARLGTLLGGRAAAPAETEAVLVVRLPGGPVGLVVDEFQSGMEVILKPMAGVLAGLGGYGGTAVLGDGRVLLVLNLKEML